MTPVGPEGVEAGRSEEKGRRPGTTGAGREQLTPAQRAAVVKSLKAGDSYGRIARAEGISKITVWRIKHELGMTRSSSAPHPGNGSGVHDPSRETGGGKRTMGEGDAGSDVRLARLEWERQRDAEDMKGIRGALGEIADRLKKATQVPPTLEIHDGAAHVACPNCGTSRDVALPPAPPGGPENFDELLGLLDAPHKEAGGKGVLDCPTCRPKLDAKLGAMGYARAPTPNPEAGD